MTFGQEEEEEEERSAFSLLSSSFSFLPVFVTRLHPRGLSVRPFVWILERGQMRMARIAIAELLTH